MKGQRRPDLSPVGFAAVAVVITTLIATAAGLFALVEWLIKNVGALLKVLTP